MKKVMIVDDEFLVRLGIKSLLRWEEYGYEIAAEAENGEEAMEKIERFNITPAKADVSIMASAAIFKSPACCEIVEDNATNIIGVAIRISE